MAVLRVDKIALVVVALITMIVGLSSHYSSDWVKSMEIDASHNSFEIRVHQICDFWPPLRPTNPPSVGKLKCPDISMERYFVAMIIICFIWSVFALVIEFLAKDLADGIAPIKWIDIGFQLALGFLLFIAAIVYMVDATQIKKFTAGLGSWADLSSTNDTNPLLKTEFMALQDSNDNALKLRHGAKIAAGVLALFQALLHGAVAGLGLKNSRTLAM